MSLIGIALTFTVPDDRTFDSDELDLAMAALGYNCESQCDHMSFAIMTPSHCDMGLAAIEAQTFEKHLATYFRNLFKESK